MHQTTCMRLAASLLQLDKKDNTFSKKCIKLITWPLAAAIAEDRKGRHQWASTKNKAMLQSER